MPQQDFLSSILGQQATLIILVAIIGGLVGWVFASVAKQWRLARVAQIEASLKRQMLDQGMAADQIAQVLQATQEKPEYSAPKFTGQEEIDKAALVTLMTEYGYSGEDIARVISLVPLPEGVHVENRQTAQLARTLAVKGMVENEKEIGEIQQMLRAFHGPEQRPIETGIRHTGLA
jgi:hypothetical protein